MDAVTAADGETLRTWQDLYMGAPKGTLQKSEPAWWREVANALTVDGKKLRHPMRRAGERASAMASLPSGARKVKWTKGAFVAVFEAEQLHDESAEPHVGRVITFKSATGSILASEYLLEHWVPVPKGADPDAEKEGLYCRCDGHCRHPEIEGQTSTYTAVQGTGKQYWHHDDRCTRNAPSRCPEMSQCDGSWAHGKGWWEEEDTLLALEGEPTEETPAVAAGQETMSKRGRKQVALRPTLEYYDPGLRTQDDEKRRALLLQARVKAVQDGDERFLREQLSQEAEAELQAALEVAAAATPGAEPRDEAQPVSDSAEQSELYYAGGAPRHWDSRAAQEGVTLTVYWQHMLANWEQIEEAELAKLGRRPGKLEQWIWTDGSLKKGQTEGAHAGLGVVSPAEFPDGTVANHPEWAGTYVGRLRGLQENNKAELQAAIVADVLAAQGVRLHTDSQNVCTWFDKFVLNAHDMHMRDYIRNTCSAELYAWSKFRALVMGRDRQRPAAVIKVKAHSDEDMHELNDAADRAADQGAHLEQEELDENIFLPPEFSMPAVLTIEGPTGIVRRVEGDPRRHAAVLHAHHTHFAWTNQLKAGEWLRLPVDHGAVYDQMAMGPRRVGVSRESNCFRGTHMKLVMGTVATALVRKRDAPELYSEVNPAGLCALCSTREIDGEGRPRLVTGPEETLEHVLTCPSAVATEARTAAEARIAATVSEALEGAQKRSVPHALSRSLKVTRVNDPTLTAAERQAQMCVLRGLPRRASPTWSARPSRTPRKLPRSCQAYAEWEKACGITKVMKERRAKAKRTGARDREADAPPDDTAGNARRKRADPEPRQRERCRECDDYGWVRASAAMQVYDHTNRTQHQQLEAAEATAGGGQ
eukprot:tig00021532_g22199.t1